MIDQLDKLIHHEPRGFFGFPPCVSALLVYAVLLIGAVALIVYGPAGDSLLYLFMVPIVLAAFAYGRRLTSAMLILVCAAAVWVAWRFSPNLSQSLFSIGLSALAAVILTETIRAVVRRNREITAALVREKEFAETLVEAAPTMICVLDREGRIIRFNKHAEAVTGYAAADVIGEDYFAALVDPQERDVARGALKDGFRDIRSFDQGAIYPLRTRQGARRYVRWYGRIVPDLLDGEVGALAIGQDVTESLASQAALQESENRYRAVSELMTDLAFAFDVEPQGNLMLRWITGAHQRLFGLTEADLVAGGAWESRLLPEDRETLTTLYERLLAGESVQSEIRVAAPAGAVRTLSVTCRPVWSVSTGEVTRIVGAAQDITERRRTERALQTSEARFREIFEASPIGIELYDDRGRLMEVNRACLAIFGVDDPASLSRFNLFEDPNLPPEAMAQLEAGESVAYQTAFDFEKVRRANLYKTRRSGLIDVDVLITPVGPSGAPSGYLVQVQDISDRIEAVRALKSSEARYRTLVENLGEGIAVVDAEEFFAFANPAAERIFGVPSGALVGKNLVDFTDDCEFERLRQRTEARLRGEAERYELTIEQPGGGVRQLLVNAVPDIAPDGEFEGTLAIFLDITERRQAKAALRGFTEALEAEVARRTAELRAERARLQAVLNSVADGLVVTDASGRITLSNPVADRWLDGALETRAVGALRDAIRSLARHRDSRPSRSLTLEGLDFRLEAAEIDGGTERAAAVVSIHDVTALKAVNRIKTRFIQDVSHELRTPTATIKLYAEMLSRASDERRTSYQEALITEADHLSMLVENILRINSIESAALDLDAPPQPLNLLIRQHVERCRRMAEAHDLDFSLDLGTGVPPVQADVGWLVDALSRLVANAVQYTPAGGRIALATSACAADGRRWAIIRVSDTGVGIPEDDLPHVFDRFYRGDYARDRQISGTGMGLPIVQEVMRLHSGRVTVESEPGEGSTFTMWLPARNPAEPSAD